MQLSPEEIRAAKSNIRKELLEKRNSLSEEDYKSLNAKLFNRLIDSQFFQEADSIFSYIAFKKEADTKNLIHYAVKKGKKIGVPKISGENIEPLSFTSWMELSPNQYGILEPTQIKPFDFTEKTLIVVPGIAFDLAGTRLGFGRGYYDRFLAEKKCRKLGLAYDFQLLRYLPVSDNDIRVDAVLTDKQLISLRP